MRNVTISRTVKLWGKWIKSGQTIEVAECEYEQLLKDGFLVLEIPGITTKKKKDEPISESD